MKQPLLSLGHNLSHLDIFLPGRVTERGDEREKGHRKRESKQVTRGDRERDRERKRKTGERERQESFGVRKHISKRPNGLHGKLESN